VNVPAGEHCHDAGPDDHRRVRDDQAVHWQAAMFPKL
jgi:hypothetical protein